jgi:hypothetical protein
MRPSFPPGRALLVGVGAARHAALSLPATARDARAIRDVLVRDSGYDEGRVRLLTDQDAHRDAIVAGLKWIQEQAQAEPEAVALVYFSGHGGYLAAEGSTGANDYYLLPHDADPAGLRATAIRSTLLTKLLLTVTCRHRLLILDCCQHGADDQGLRTSELPESYVGEITRGGWVVLTSSRHSQRSYTDARGGLSLFSRALVEALQRRGSDAAHVTLADIVGYVSREVPRAARQLGVVQEPRVHGEWQDFALGLAGTAPVPAPGFDAASAGRPRWPGTRPPRQPERALVVFAGFEDHLSLNASNLARGFHEAQRDGLGYLEFRIEPGLSPAWLRQELLSARPALLHLAGKSLGGGLEWHGQGVVSWEAVAALIEWRLRCLVLLADDSAAAAPRFAGKAEQVVGVRGSLDSQARLAVVRGFYGALARGATVGEALVETQTARPELLGRLALETF